MTHYNIEKRKFFMSARVYDEFYHGEAQYKSIEISKDMWCLVEKESGEPLLWSEKRENIEKIFKKQINIDHSQADRFMHNNENGKMRLISGPYIIDYRVTENFKIIPGSLKILHDLEDDTTGNIFNHQGVIVGKVDYETKKVELK